jgi:cold-inducible RNA-binding protein
MARKLFVGNLPWEVRSARLGEILREQGLSFELAEVLEERDTGRSRGFGFVHFASDQDAELARRKLSGLELRGRAIRVDDASRNDGGRRQSQSRWSEAHAWDDVDD